jgi:hypothetical protein
MAQLALLSQVAVMKQKDMDREMDKDKPKDAPGPRGKRLNRDNADAFNLIASGILG